MKKYKLFYVSLLAACLSATGSYGQWSALPQLITGSDTVRSISMIRAFDTRLFACTDKGLYMSYDDGDNWTNLTAGHPVTSGKNIISFYYDFDLDRLYAGTDAAVYVSGDNGLTWSATAITSIVRANDITKSGFNILVSYGVPGNPAGGVYYSEDNLATYKSASIPGLPKFGLLTDGPYAYATGTDGAFKTSDFGATWSLSGIGHPAGARYSRIIRQNSNLFAGDINGMGLMRSKDFGASWNKANPAVFNGFCQVYDISASNDIILAAVNGACNTDGPIKASQDEGLTWRTLMDGLPPGIYNHLGRNTSGSCFFTFSEADRHLYRICNAVSIEGTTAAAPAIQLWPNPADETLHIGGLRSATVRISDVSGRVLYEQTFHNQEISLPVQQLAKGVYFVSLQQQGQRTSHSFIKQ